ncbi:hypothetical protein Dacet_0999 [Denitrovibrio acetiphilus DSM 12809]|uniref:Uncharacterized protein n=1 Tax=Denitrovibrio acetiphilus (strain DSM 12809 / NBRC 114555 / N2460) TaxID=522772 RepID=D4H6Q9_DENA2|nr:hypothetical protein [Denitrovibrio acetiphilus]ADD67775.1 hypothetical protein Dacet_0999 [Denitrovibrio acetiphilus DSM 12809]
MGCCSGDDNNGSCGCNSGPEQDGEMMNFSFSMDKEMFEDVNESAKTNNMAFEEFIYNCIEVGLAITAGDLALIDTDQLELDEDGEDTEEEEA